MSRVGAEGICEEVPETVYVAETGHHIGGPILKWWLQYGRDSTIGWPITEPVRHGGDSVQYFERGGLRTDATTADPLGVVQLDLGTAWALRQDQAEQPHDYEWWFRQTERGVHVAFWEPFRETGAAFTYGYPILWADKIDGKLRQTFGRSVWTATSQGLVQEPVGEWEAEFRGLSTTPVEQTSSALLYQSEHWPTQPVYPSVRWAEVDLTHQVTTFFADGHPVYQALISTGVPPDFTPAGEYQIFSRHERTDMSSNGSTFRTYSVPDVLFTQYFTTRWIGFHYAYWHDGFGDVQSAGCVNMRLADAQWAWGFCGNGTPVRVHT